MIEQTVRDTVHIGITGFQGAGKTTVGTMLAEKLNARVLHIADPIKTIVRDLNPHDFSGVPLSAVLESEGEGFAKENHLPYRQHLRGIGEAIRHRNPGFWWDWLMDRSTGLRCVIVPDVRFQYEADKCAVIIHVDRPGVESTGHDSDTDMRHHADVIINNDGTLDDLREKVSRFVDDLELEGPLVY